MRVFPTAVLLAILSTCAHARSASATEAEDLFEQGRAALEENKLDVACELFRRSQEKDAAPGTLLNLADCEERRGNRVTAHGLFAEVARQPDALFSSEGKKRMAALEAQLSKVTLRVDGPLPLQARLTLDGLDVAPGQARFVEPGPHLAVLSGPTLEIDDTKRATSTAGQSLELTFSSAPSPRPTDDTTASSADVPGIGLAGIVVGGVGVVVLGAAIGTGVAMLGVGACFPDEGAPEDPSCDRSSAAADEGRALEAASTALFIAGGVLTATGVVLLAVAPWGGEGERAANVSMSVGLARVQLALSF